MQSQAPRECYPPTEVRTRVIDTIKAVEVLMGLQVKAHAILTRCSLQSPVCRFTWLQHRVSTSTRPSVRAAQLH